ncbi:MAG: methylated-DNA--[protein]-cysteine S-methyltransferase [Stellaceae bacterium]
MKLSLEEIPSPIGPMLVVSDGEVLRSLDFVDYAPRMNRLLRLHYGDVELREAPVPRGISAAIRDYFEGAIAAIDRVRTATGGTAFQRAVWAALRTIPAGSTWSYGALAERIGRPRARRAVGLANGANPIAIVVPCHRVIGADGSLTGYGGGVDRKRWLLEHEGGWPPAR